MIDGPRETGKFPFYTRQTVPSERGMRIGASALSQPSSILAFHSPDKVGEDYGLFTLTLLSVFYTVIPYSIQL